MTGNARAPTGSGGGAGPGLSTSWAGSRRSRRATQIVEVAGRSIGIFNVNGGVPRPAQPLPAPGRPLCEGRLSASCAPRLPGEYAYPARARSALPWHGWEFDVRNGPVLVRPGEDAGAQLRGERGERSRAGGCGGPRQPVSRRGLRRRDVRRLRGGASTGGRPGTADRPSSAASEIRQRDASHLLGAAARGLLQPPHPQPRDGQRDTLARQSARGGPGTGLAPL